MRTLPTVAARAVLSQLFSQFTQTHSDRPLRPSVSLSLPEASVSDQTFLCLFSHKCSEQAHLLGKRLASALSHYSIELLIDPFRYGDEFNTRMETFDFDA